VRAASPTTNPFAAASLLLIIEELRPDSLAGKKKPQSFVRAFGLMTFCLALDWPIVVSVSSARVDQGLP